MLIEATINWTFTAPLPSTPYPVDIYWRYVGESTYNMVSVSTGESETATITLYNSTSDTISDRELPCNLEIEGYVVPTCANNDISERVAFVNLEEDVTDLMQCRQIKGTCDAGGIFGVIPDPDPLLIFSTDPLIPPVLSWVSGTGDNTAIPTITIIWTNPSAAGSTIQEIVVSNSSTPLTPYYDQTSVFEISGLATDKLTPVTMTPTVKVGCWGPLTECYTENTIETNVITVEEDIVQCVNNSIINDDYDDLNNLGTVTVDPNYYCCQDSECKVFQLTWNGSTNHPSITSITLRYISGTTGQLTSVNMNTLSPPLTINAIPDTIGASTVYAAAFDDGIVTITEIGPCS